MSSSFWLAALGYLLPTFPLGYFWHLRTFADRYEALEIYREKPLIPFGLAAMMIQSMLYSFLYPRLFDTAHEAWLGSAARFGLTFGGLAWSLAVLPVAAKHRMASAAAFLRLETAFTALHYAIVSPLIALAWRAQA